MTYARSLVQAAFLAVALLALPGCDNIGRVFDPGGGRGGGGEPDPANSFQVPPAGGITGPNRPRMLFAGPTGNGLPPTTPVVVLFDESMNLDSISGSAGERPEHLHVRVQGTTEALPGTYTALLGGRLIVFRPSTTFPPSQTLEVVIGNKVRDIDKQTSQRQGVVATFTADGTVEAGFKLLATFPRNNDSDAAREGAVYVITTAPADPQTLTGDNIFLQKSDRSRVASRISFPVQTGPAPDPRIIELAPNAPLEASTKFEIKITDDVKAGEVVLDRGNKDPVATFTSIGPLAAQGVEVGNPSAGFDNRVNIANLQNLMVAVDLSDATVTGDEVTVRIYGNDRKETQDVLVFEEASTTVGSSGAQRATVSFAGRLGTVPGPSFKDGDLTLVASVRRGGDVTGYIIGPETKQDVTAPTITAVGPPTASDNAYLTDLTAVSIHGQASERVGSLQLTVGSQTVDLFGADEGGRFMSLPALLGRTTAPVPYTLALTDDAGNAAAGPFQGTFVQRGVLTGTVSGGKLTVEAYDDATLAPVSGASVLIEPGLPRKPSVGRLTATTDATGRAVFSGLTQASYSITIIRSGYHLTSLLDTGAGYASLPLRPLADATASLTATLVFPPGAGVLARVGINALDDEAADGFVQTTAAATNRVTNVPVRPNRPLLVTAFAGAMPPTTKPTFGSGATLLGAQSGARGTNQPPPEAQAGGGSYDVALTLLPALNAFLSFGSTYQFDLSTATGLDTSKLVANPTVSIAASLPGFGGQVYLGPGFSSGSGTTWTIDGSYSLLALLDFGVLGPVVWASTQAVDQDGNLTRNRALFTNALLGAVQPLAAVAGVPTIRSSGTFTGSPAVQIADRLPPSMLAGSLSMRRIRVVDPNGRQWHLLYADADAATGTDLIQLPDLAGTGLVGLAKGAWQVSAEDYFVVAGFTATELNLEELSRFAMTYARSKSVEHTVQ